MTDLKHHGRAIIGQIDRFLRWFTWGDQDYFDVSKRSIENARRYANGLRNERWKAEAAAKLDDRIERAGRGELMGVPDEDELPAFLRRQAE